MFGLAILLMFFFSPLNVAGCFKNAVVIWLSMLQGDMVTRRQWEGFVVSTAGFLLYSWAKTGSEKVQENRRSRSGASKKAR
jgi:hypothetical protein